MRAATTTQTEFRIADTFADSLTRLTGEEQKAFKTTAFDLQLNPANPGMSFHKLDKPKDKKFWSVRVSGDIRLIVHRSEASLLLCPQTNPLLLNPSSLWRSKRGCRRGRRCRRPVRGVGTVGADCVWADCLCC
jgi:mRNA-degrading endonuclease RelE of RelBE toxin-antitoxin system